LKDVSSPYLVSIRYLEKELFVDTDQTTETEFPVLLMDWVEGKTLDKYLRENLGNNSALNMLAYRFRQLTEWLLNQPFAHGDLKPDNILVREDGSLVLVDYDGMYVPAMSGQIAREMGSTDFRNPHREIGEFDENIDLFSLISIFISLSIIAYDSDTLTCFGSADRLLFSLNDYLDLQTSELYNYIFKSFRSNGKIQRLTEVLRNLCEGEPVTTKTVSSVMHILGFETICSFYEDSILPSSENYIDAFTKQAFFFRTLVDLRTTQENSRIVYVKGSNSVVFKMQDLHTGKYYAIKCYAGVKYDIYNRMKIVQEKLDLVESPYLVKMNIVYNELNIKVNGFIDKATCYYPIVIMDWIDGVTLDHYHPKSEESEKDFKQLISNYKTMSSWLLEQSFSHGDISPKNIIVTKDNDTLLIDYDNVVFSDEDVVPVSVEMKDEDFCNPCQTSFKYEDNIDNFSLVSIMISLIFQFESTSKPWKRAYYFYGYFLKKEDYTDLDKSNLYKNIDKCYSSEYELSNFRLCLKQQLRSTVFSKEEIKYLFKDRLSKVEDINPYRYEGPNARIEKKLGKFSSAYGVLTFIAPFLLISYTGLNLLSVSIVMSFSSIVLCLLLFTAASFRPYKKSSIDIGDDRYVGFGCLGSIGIFMPVLFMSDLTKDLINNNIDWLHIPAYNEPWYITVVIWVLFFLTNQLFMSSFMEKVYDYDTLKFDIRNKKYTNKREKFIDKLSEDEYNYRNLGKFQDSRLRNLISVNIIVILGILYTLYCFYFQQLDLIYTNLIIALLSLGATFLVKPILKDKYAVYSHKLGKVYWNITLIKMFLPMITIPFAFAGFTDFLNSTFSISIPPYELGMKEFIINAGLYILIYFSPFLKNDV
jgi:thiamine kinase-like enzyme